jgi:hypothetical protein
MKKLRLWPKPRTCLDCGFLTRLEGQEATPSARLTIHMEGSDGWFPGADEAHADCAKGFWRWDTSPFEVIIHEAKKSRNRCPGFMRYSPGRSPESHLKLEDEQRTFRHQKLLAGLAFLGGLFGALLGAFLKSK